MRLSTSTAIIVGLAALLLFASALAGPPLYTITKQVTPEGAGTIQIDPLKDGYQKNNIVTVTAVVRWFGSSGLGWVQETVRFMTVQRHPGPGSMVSM